MHPLFMIVVFDALRPDMVTPELAPNLCRFRDQGVGFPNSRAIFPTSTRTNAAALATGATARGHGIVGNRYYDPNIYRDRLFEPNRVAAVEDGRRAYGGSLYTTPSLGDLLAASGYSMATVLSGMPGTARLCDPNAPDHGHINIGLMGWDESGPTQVTAALLAEHGPVPPATRPNIAASRMQTDMVIGTIYPRHQPDVSIVWFSDPDQSYHYHGVGSPEAVQAIRHVDAQFGRILDWWRGSPLHDRLQIVAVSDHGHLTARERIDVNGEAARAGLGIGNHFEDGADYAGYTSYSGSLRVRDRDPRRMKAMVEWLDAQPWCGMLFSRGGNGIEGCVPGTFDYALVQMDHPRAPDVAYVMLNDDAVHGGIAGSCFYNGPYPHGGGTHGGLHPKELNNLLIAQGSLFESGVSSIYPAGIIDVAPTILHLLGLPQPAGMDGRVLVEALRPAKPPPDAETFIRSVERGTRTQHLAWSRVGSTIYLNAGWME